MAVGPDRAGFGRVSGAVMDRARSPLVSSARGPVPPGESRTWFVVTVGVMLPSAWRIRVASRLRHFPSTRVRVGTAVWVSSTVPSGRAVTVEVEVPAAVASTGLPMRRASAIARSTPSGASAGFAADAAGAVAAAGGAARPVAAPAATTAMAATDPIAFTLAVPIGGLFMGMAWFLPRSRVRRTRDRVRWAGTVNQPARPGGTPKITPGCPFRARCGAFDPRATCLSLPCRDLLSG
ncbi:hypothetical protein MCAG_04693 [Micromonospora sp. ATCC 39149]|nr:hypothetical protein MCAG_04693 [Micromonospora sp. ATCC 39149]